MEAGGGGGGGDKTLNIPIKISTKVHKKKKEKSDEWKDSKRKQKDGQTNIQKQKKSQTTLSNTKSDNKDSKEPEDEKKNEDEGCSGEDEKMLKEFPFYHGFLPREDLFILLQNVGDYLVRLSEVEINADNTKIRREIILSVFAQIGGQSHAKKEVSSGGAADRTLLMTPTQHGKKGSAKRERASTPPDKSAEKGKIKNVIIRRKHNKYVVEQGHLFDSLKSLFNYYEKNYGTLNKIRFTLKSPICLQTWEYLHSNVKTNALLGEGAFGEVRAGTLMKKNGKEVEVAIKVTKGNTDLSKAKIKEMMKEARLMRNFKHKNIVRIYGVAVDEQPLFIILELVKGGALNSFLVKNAGKVEINDKIGLCIGAAMGVEYLHLNDCMHRDLAARNCLITEDNIVKISDFGLSRLGSSYTIKACMKLPIKWLAPETINTFSFSMKSDVFSYGVLVYEIFADGGEPWEGKTNAAVKVLVTSGKMLELPKSCPESLRNFVYEKMYNKDPTKRATMTEIVKTLESAKSQSKSISSRSPMKKAGSSLIHAPTPSDK